MLTNDTTEVLSKYTLRELHPVSSHLGHTLVMFNHIILLGLINHGQKTVKINTCARYISEYSVEGGCDCDMI